MSRLKQARKKAGYTQVELAELAQTDQESISRYEAGKVRLGIEVAMRIATVLKTDPLYLMGRQNTPELLSTTQQ